MLKILIVIFLSCISFSGITGEKISEISEQYVRLVLALGEHDAAYVDAYYGPKQWALAAKENKITLGSIITASNQLIDQLQLLNADTEMSKLRFSYLKAQLSALNARALMLTGDMALDFDAQSRALYNTEAPHHKLVEFEQTLKQLDQLLPGEQSLVEKVNLFNQQFIIPKEKVAEVFDIAIAECKARTQLFVDLPDIENFKLEFVSNKPWSGYNWYKGGAFSLIQVNTEHPISISRAIDLGCHEGYPGHHTYNALLEANLVNKRGWKEFTVYPLFSPQSLIAEGSANYGIEMAFPGEQKTQFEKDKLFPIAGIDPSLAEKYHQFSLLTGKLKYTGNEVARKYLNKDINKQQAIDLLQHYSLMSQEKASQRIDFLNAYGAYVINYNWGKDMVKRWVESGKDQSQEGRWKRFSKLLSSPRLPSTLN